MALNEIAKRVNKNVYRDGQYCYKAFSADYPTSDILNEALNQSRVYENGLFVPRVYEVKKIDDGRLAIVMDYIDGKSLAQLIDEYPENKNKYIDRLIEVQMSVHEFHADNLNKQRDKFNRKINISGLDATTRYELHARLDSMHKRNKLCHGDFNPSNVIITSDDRACIIDWSHVTVGNASADIARTYLLFKLAGDDETAEYYLKAYCKRSDTAMQYIQNWLPIVAASQMAKGKPDEKEFLMKWAEVCQYE